jgi:ABC-type multidrug transport system ATPase subunit
MNVAIPFHFIFSFLFPTYNLGGTLVFFMTKYAFDDNLTVGDTFTKEMAVPFYCAPFHVIILASIFIFRETRSFRAVPGQLEEFDGSRKDEDVLAEEKRVETTAPTEQEAVRYQGLFHTYRSRISILPLPIPGVGKLKTTHAVRGISLGIKRGECFGLLGPNGAGKTTTLAVLTGEVRPPTAGTVTIMGNDIAQWQGLMKAYQVLGVCPQVDPLWDNVSGRDHLIFYGRLKGVPEAELRGKVDQLLSRLGLDQNAAVKLAGKYSGGMKRKLSLGIALIGHSPVLFLDEPSAAVDAGAKRHLWKVIEKRGPDQTVILTTHSMEEAEALCDRLAIQVQGQLRCLGTSAHLKRRYSSGYQLELIMRSGGSTEPAQGQGPPPPGTPGDTDATPQRIKSFADGPSEKVMTFVREQVSAGAKLLENVANHYLFQLPPRGEEGGVALSHVFRVVESQKEALGIQNFSVTQPSLEQVFLRFAKEQTDAELREQK